jgi:uncharacterized protein (TIGR02444 family)
MINEAEAGFWNFSLTLYALPGVAEACLRLQDVAGKDVNLALYCLYAGMVLGRRIDGNELSLLGRSIEPWNEAAVRPLREVRRRLKSFDADPESAALRRRIQALELEAERLAQSRLCAALPDGETGDGSLDLGRANLLLYGGDEAQGLLTTVREGLG